MVWYPAIVSEIRIWCKWLKSLTDQPPFVDNLRISINQSLYRYHTKTIFRVKNMYVNWGMKLIKPIWAWSVNFTFILNVELVSNEYKSLLYLLSYLHHNADLIWAKSWENLFMPYANNKGADQPEHSRSLISAFVVRCLDSIIHLVSIPEISSFYLASVVVQTCFCLPWSQTPKTGFLVMGLIWPVTVCIGSTSVYNALISEVTLSFSFSLNTSKFIMIASSTWFTFSPFLSMTSFIFIHFFL